MPSPYEKMFNCAMKAVNKINDKAIAVAGQEVCIIVPDIETVPDIYGVTAFEHDDEFITHLSIDWSAWRFVLSAIDSGDEFADLPVTATAKVSDCIPIGSLVKIEVGHLGINTEFNTFEVISNETLSSTTVYGRRLTLVPHRGRTY